MFFVCLLFQYVVLSYFLDYKKNRNAGSFLRSFNWNKLCIILNFAVFIAWLRAPERSSILKPDTKSKWIFFLSQKSKIAIFFRFTSLMCRRRNSVRACHSKYNDYDSLRIQYIEMFCPRIHIKSIFQYELKYSQFVRILFYMFLFMETIFLCKCAKVPASICIATHAREQEQIFSLHLFRFANKFTHDVNVKSD